MLSVLRNKAIPLRVRKKIGKIYPIPNERDFQIPMFAHEYIGRTGTHLDDKVYLYGLHEPSTIHLMRQILIDQKQKGKKTNYMDIGTNVGMHLIALADLIDRGYGFEPWKPVRDIAVEKLKSNNIEHIKIFDYGLSNKNGSCPFMPPANNNIGVGSFCTDENAAQTDLVLEIRNGDNIVEDYKIEPTLIKIDVEGHEKLALQGLKNTIKKHKPVIIFEYAEKSREDLSQLDLLQDLFGPAYKFYGIRRSREFPKLTKFNPDKKYENILAYPGKMPDFNR